MAKITAKVTKGKGDKYTMISNDFKPYEGKMLTIEVIGVSDIIVTEKPAQGVTITEVTKPVQVK